MVYTGRMTDQLQSKLVISSLEDVFGLVGTPLGPSAWHTITQDAIDRFAEATENPAPNHTDPDYAAKTPLKTTIAFGIQVLAMATALLGDIWELRGVTSGADYGSNRVRHLAPVPVDARVRLQGTIANAEPVDDDGVRITLDLEFEMEGGTRPACVAQIVHLLRFAQR